MTDSTLADAPPIAARPQNPSRLSPVESSEKARERRNHVVDRMGEEKDATGAEVEGAKREPVLLHLRKEPPSIAPYFLEEVRKYLEREYGSQRIYQGGLRGYTTLDPRMQAAATRALRNGLLQLDRKARGWVPPQTSLLDAQGL